MISRRILAALALLCAIAAPAHAQKTKDQLNSLIGTSFPNNAVGAITPTILRSVTNDIVNSILPSAPVAAGNLPCFNGTTGLLKDCNSLLPPFSVGGPSFNAGTLLTTNNNTSRLPIPPVGTLLHVGAADGAATVGLLDSFGSSTFSTWNLRRARGSASSPSAVQFLDNLGILGAIGYAATGYSLTGSQIRFIAAENFTDSAQGTFTSIFTTPAGSTASAFTERFRSGASGLGIGGANNVSFGRLDILSPGSFIAGTASPDPTLVVNQNTVALPATANLASEKWAIQVGGPDGIPPVIGIDSFGTGNLSVFSVLDFRRTNGTAATPTALRSGDLIGVLGGIGYAATHYSGGAVQMRYYATQDWTDGAQGGAIAFLTTANNIVAAGNALERVRIDQSGFVGIGSNSPSSLLHVNKNTVQNVAAEAGTVAQISGADSANTYFQIDTFGAANSQFGQLLFRQAAGTAAAKTGIQANAVLGVIGAAAYTSAGAYTLRNGQVQFIATEIQTAGAQGQAVAVWGTPNGSTTLSEVARFQVGLSVGTTSDPGAGLIYTNSASFMLRTKTSLSNGAAAQTATLTNSPAAGNPTKWLPYDDNGTTRYIPAW